MVQQHKRARTLWVRFVITATILWLITIICLLLLPALDKYSVASIQYPDPQKKSEHLFTGTAPTATPRYPLSVINYQSSGSGAIAAATLLYIALLVAAWRITHAPLRSLARQITHTATDSHPHGYLHWRRNDELGTIAQGANNLINQLLRKNEQITQLESRQNALIAGLPDAICIFSTRAELSTLYKQPDYTLPIPGLIIGSPLTSPIFPQSDCQTFERHLAQAFKTNTVQLLMLACRNPDNTYRHLETRINRIEPLHALVVFRDVTKEWSERSARKVMEERIAQVARFESLGHLAASTAHDFNNILAIIQNTIEACWGATPPAGQREAISTLRDATTRGANLTRELMTYAGQTHFIFKRTPLNRLILDTEKLMSGLLTNNISLEMRLANHTLIVEADPLQFWKVVVNILKNASEAIGPNRGHIMLRTYPFTMTEAVRSDFFSTNELQPMPGAILQIDDTGRGIPPDILTRLFEPFYSTKSVRRGLGLSTVFGIVDAHSGGIAITSKPGQGASFRIWLPLSQERYAVAGTQHPESQKKSEEIREQAQEGEALPLLPGSHQAGDAVSKPLLSESSQAGEGAAGVSGVVEPERGDPVTAEATPVCEQERAVDVDGSGERALSALQEESEPRESRVSGEGKPGKSGESAVGTLPAAAPPAVPYVLSIEDDPAILKTNGLLLKMIGVTPLLASTRQEAQTLFSRHAAQIKLILIDAQSGRLDNVRLLATLRAHHPTIPVIVTSGLSEAHIAELFATTPYDVYLSKPYSYQDLKRCVCGLVEVASKPRPVSSK